MDLLFGGTAKSASWTFGPLMLALQKERRLLTSAVRSRRDLLQAMLDKAAGAALPTEELTRLPLSAKRPDANGRGMGTLKEEE